MRDLLLWGMEAPRVIHRPQPTGQQTGTMLGELDQTCKLKAGNQQADYHCPEHFDAVVRLLDVDVLGDKAA